MSVYVKNPERSQINNLMIHLEVLRKKNQSKPKSVHGKKE
jgi:hypothetical protein